MATSPSVLRDRDNSRPHPCTRRCDRSSGGLRHLRRTKTRDGRRRRSHPLMHRCGASRTSPALPTQAITSASTAGSMPAWRPVRSDRPTTPVPPGLLMDTENVTAVAPLSNGTRAMAVSRHDRPGWPERRERTVAGGWGPGPALGTLAIVFRLLRRWRRRAGVLTDSCSPQAAFSGLGTGTGVRHARDGLRPGCGRRGRRADLASRGRREARTAIRRQCVALAEREAQSGDAAEPIEATAEPDITVAAPDSVPWGQSEDLATHFSARFAHHVRVDAPHPGVRVTLPAGRVTAERTWIGVRVTLD
jgi:hypothetical protein